MHIGIVVPGFGADDDDPCIPAVTHYVKKLAERHSVRVFALRYPDRRTSYRAHGAEIFPLGGGQTRGLSKLLLLGRAVATIRREHARAPLEGLHAFWADEPGFVATRAARKLGLASLVSVAGGELVAMPDIAYGGGTSRWNRFWLSRSLHDADAVGVGSTATGLQVEGNCRAVRYLPLGIDLEQFHPAPRTASRAVPLEGSPVLLHVASLSPIKDQETLLRAFALVHEASPDAVLHIVGDGVLRGPLEELREALGLSANVRFHGFVAHAAIADYYRASDLLVMTSRHEAQGMVVLEAAAAGLPVVGTAVGALEDLAPAAVTVPRRDRRALADAVLGLMDDAAKRSALAAEAAARVSEVFAIDVVIRRFEAAYREAGFGRTRYKRKTSFKRSRSATTSTA